MENLYPRLRASIQSFDILLFSGRGIVSKGIQTITQSKWSHVGLALNLEHWDQLLCYESTTLSDVKDELTHGPAKGVQLVQLSSRIEMYDGEISIRPIYGPRNKEMMGKAAAFMREFNGKPYEQSQLELLRSALDLFPWHDNEEDSSSVFCSELTASMLRAIGVLREGKSANEFTPADFAEDLDLYGNYTIGHEVAIKF